MTSTIVGLCWRLHYIQCPASTSDLVASIGGRQSRSKWVDAQKLKKIHPCCQILRQPSQGSNPMASRVSRWLHHNPTLV